MVNKGDVDEDDENLDDEEDKNSDDDNRASQLFKSIKSKFKGVVAKALEKKGSSWKKKAIEKEILV